jgi:hypothetical protein
MKRYSFLALVIILNIHNSCTYDPPPPSVRIYNGSTNPVKLVVQYNKSVLHEFPSNSSMSSLKSYTGDYYGDCTKIIALDTTTLIGKYMLGTNCTFSLRFSRGIEPKFKFDLIEIIKEKDTMKISGSIDSLYKLKKRSFQQYELRIK